MAMICLKIPSHDLKLKLSRLSLHQQEALVRLRALMPNGQLPKAIDGSQDILMIKAAIDKELRTASKETLHLAWGHMIQLCQTSIPVMQYYRDPPDAWVSSHPHWLDRIVYVKASNHLQREHEAGPRMLEHILKTQMVVRRGYKPTMPLLTGQRW